MASLGGRCISVRDDDSQGGTLVLGERGPGSVVTPELPDLIAFFQSEPVEEHQGYTLFKVADAKGVVLHFSFDVLERSVQTSIEFSGQSISVVSHEELSTISLHRGKLVAICEYGGIRTTCTIDVAKDISVRWSSLVVR